MNLCKKLRCGVDRYVSLKFSRQTELLRDLGVYVFDDPDVDVMVEWGGPVSERWEDEGSDSYSDISSDDVEDLESDLQSDTDSSESSDFEIPEAERKRICVKTLVLPPHLEPHLKAVQSCKVPDCRLRRELNGADIYSINFGTSKFKPGNLALWNQSEPRGFAKLIYAVAGRETGLIYYSEQRVHESVSFTWLARVLGSFEKIYARVVLLLSPSYMVRVPPHSDKINVKVDTRDNKNIHGIDPFDGLSFCGPDAGYELGMISLEELLEWRLILAGWGDRMVTRAFQFRAVLYVKDFQETILAKGICIIDPRLGDDLLISPECIKARSREVLTETHCFTYGMDVTRTSDVVCASPCLTGSLCAVLKLRTACVNDKPKRYAAGLKYDVLVETARVDTLNRIQHKAWGVHVSFPDVRKTVIRQTNGDNDFWSDNRLPCHVVDVISQQRNAPVNKPETELALLCTERIEDRPHLARRGTKEALLRGQCNLLALYSSHNRKPRLHIPGLSGTVTAVSDPMKVLQDGQCYVIMEGVAYEGRCAVWRSPSHCVRDICVMCAMQPPLLCWLPDNCIVLSTEGYVNTLLAGGDLDGDLNMVSFWEPLVKFLDYTQSYVDRLDFARYEDEIKSRLDPSKRSTTMKATDARSLGDEYCKLMLATRTPQLRGQVCAAGERVSQRALLSKYPLADGTFEDACIFSFISHKVLDVPKHYPPEPVLELCVEYMRKFKLDNTKLNRRTFKRSSKVIAPTLRIKIPQFKKSRVFEMCTPILNKATMNKPLGQVWLPLREVVLGRTAGKLIMEVILTIPRGQKCYDRSPVRSPLVELAYFLRHRMVGMLGSDLAEDWATYTTADFTAALKGCRKNQITSWATLLDYKGL